MTIDNNNSEWVNVVQTFKKCPHCEQGQLDTRIKRGFFVRNLFVWMNVRRYQCNSCGKKVYIKNYAQHQLHF